MARRDMGKLVFLDLVDRSGRIQLLVQPDRSAELDVSLGDMVGVTGGAAQEPSRRAEPRGRQLELLAKTRRPLPDTFHGVTDVETRYRQRYLDLLMSEESRAARDRAHQDRRRDPRATSTGRASSRWRRRSSSRATAAAFAEPFVTHSNELDADLYLRIADELYLKRLIVGGLEKVYELVEGLPQREHLVQALARVHAARVVRGIRRLPRHDGAHRGARPGGRARPWARRA